MKIEDLEVGSITNLLTDLEACIQWAESVTQRKINGRLQIYRANLMELLDLIQKNDFRSINADLKIYANALYEAAEATVVFLGLEKYDGQELSDRLRRSLSGPASYVEESNSANNIPRNKQFELLVASRASLSNFEIKLDPTHDAILSVEGVEVNVECKRITSSKKIERNINKAMKQLDLDAPESTETKGVVAIDIAKSANPKFGVREADSIEQVAEQVRADSDQFVKESLEGADYERRNFLGFLIRNSCIGYVKPTGLIVYEQRYLFYPTAMKGTHDEVIAQTVARKLKYPPPK